MEEIVQLPLYHVTNQPESDEQPNWKAIRPSLNCDLTYDGVLCGLSTASFSATRFGKQIPNSTTYPTKGRGGESYHRAHSLVDLSDFKVFKMHEYKSNKSGAKQVQLLFLHRSDGLDQDCAKTLRLLQFTELTGTFKILMCFLGSFILLFLGPNYGGYLRGGKPNNYYGNKTMINCHFIRHIKVIAWDTVERKRGTSSGHIENPSSRKHEFMKLENLCDWFANLLDNINVEVNFDDLPDRFSRPDVARKEYQQARRVASTIANCQS
jgi:hypothetical protein